MHSLPPYSTIGDLLAQVDFVPPAFLQVHTPFDKSDGCSAYLLLRDDRTWWAMERLFTDGDYRVKLMTSFKTVQLLEAATRALGESWRHYHESNLWC